MEKETKRKKKEENGEVFYKAHPIAQPIGRIEHREHALSDAVDRVLWWALAIVEIVLLLRMLIAAVGATGGNLITSLIYSVSYPFVWFFFYLFNTTGSINVTAPRFELETLAAMAFYYIVIYIITEIIKGFRTTE